MTAWENWLMQLTEARRDERLSPCATALRIIHGPFVDRFGIKRLEAWLEATDWLDWPGMFCGNGAEEFVKRCGVPMTEGVGSTAKFVPGTWRGGNWVRLDSAVPEPDVSREEAGALLAELSVRLSGESVGQS